MRIVYKMADNEGSANIFILGRFELVANKRVCLAQRNSPLTKMRLKFQIEPLIGTGTFNAKLAPSLSGIWRENSLRENRLSRSIFSCECSTNLILEQKSSRNETHSGFM